MIVRSCQDNLATLAIALLYVLYIYAYQSLECVVATSRALLAEDQTSRASI